MKIFTNKKGLPYVCPAKPWRSRKASAKQGFTLIELLVVISIISLLSSVVLANLQSAKKKAQDSKVVSQLLEMKKLAEINNNGVYGTANGSDCGTLGTALYNAGFYNEESWPSIDGVSVIPICHANTETLGESITSYSIWNQLNNGKGWCVDSRGNSVEMPSAPNTDNCVSGSLLNWGEVCTSHAQCVSGICGYIPEQISEQNPHTKCTDGSPTVLCTDNSQCASNSCDIGSSYTCN